MLFVVFQLGDDRYALDAGQIEEILPLVSIKPIPRAPHGFAGVFNYRGAPMPVVDLNELVLDRPAQQRLSTRIIVVHYDSAEKHLLGLIVEKALETLRHETNEFVATGLSGEHVVGLGPVATDAHGLLQWIDVRKLLPASLRDVLFQKTVES